MSFGRRCPAWAAGLEHRLGVVWVLVADAVLAAGVGVVGAELEVLSTSSLEALLAS